MRNEWHLSFSLVPPVFFQFGMITNQQLHLAGTGWLQPLAPIPIPERVKAFLLFAGPMFSRLSPSSSPPSPDIRRSPRSVRSAPLCLKKHQKKPRTPLSQPHHIPSPARLGGLAHEDDQSPAAKAVHDWGGWKVQQGTDEKLPERVNPLT